MKLKDICSVLSVDSFRGDPEARITSVTVDSRQVTPGALFIAVLGSKADGHDYINDAVARGAIAVLADTKAKDRANQALGLQNLLLVNNTRRALPLVGKVFYQDPASKLRLLGIVGTNGKTTSTFLVRSILEEAGYKTGLIGTISNTAGKKTIPSHNTTPGPLELQALFKEMVQEKMEYVVMEVSSHAIAQERIAELTFDGGLFTNITQDHLDFHGSFEEYFRVKSSFFRGLPSKARAVINIDDPRGIDILGLTSAMPVTFGLAREAQVRAEGITFGVKGTEFLLTTPHGQTTIKSKLIGDFNLHNILGALGMGYSLGIDNNTLRQGIEKVAGVPGRFQTITGADDFTVVVDYAHSPDGLQKVLKTARLLTKNRVITVFGCGGDRDRTKRPLMGGIAADLSDLTIITNDNPRSEEPSLIAREIEEGYLEKGNPSRYRIVLDRKKAIQEAIFLARPGDIVVIAGKGHENYQIFKDRVAHFDDRETALSVLEMRKND